MSGTVAYICPWCRGRVTSSRKPFVDLSTAMDHHEAVCPNAPLPAAPVTTTTRRTS